MTESTRPSRRTVMKGAWAAPVVVLVTAAPAFAASGDADVLTTIRDTSDREGGPNFDGLLTVNINFTNINTGPTGAVTLLVRFLSPVSGTSSNMPTDVSPGWTAVGGGTNGQFDRTFTFTSVEGIPGATTATGTGFATLSFTIRTVATTSSGTITTTATSDRGVIRPGSGVWL